MAETVFSSLKRSLDCALRARTWYREFCEVALMCAVYNIKKAGNSAPFMRLNATPNHMHNEMCCSQSSGSWD